MHRTQFLAPTAPGKLNTNPIFVVDDNAEYAALLRNLLWAWNVPNEVRHFADGLAVIEYMKQCCALNSPRCPRPSLMFLDIRMPRVGGLEVLAWLKNTQIHHVPVIAVSGTPSWSEVAKAYELGANFFVGKCQEAELRDKIHKFLALHVSSAVFSRLPARVNG